MFAEQRHEKIIELLKKRQSLTIQDLVRHLQASPATLRRDLKILASQGRLKRSHGGALMPAAPALPKASDRYEPLFGLKTMEHVHEKHRIAEAAAAEIHEGDVICLDSGSTTLCMVPYLKKFSRLTVVTNSLDLCFALRDFSEIQLIQLGGEFRSLSHSFIGPATIAALKSLRIEKAFLACSGLTLKEGLQTTDTQEAEVKATMIARSKKSLLLVDASKMGLDSLCSFSPLSAMSRVITDKAAPADFVRSMAKLGPKITQV